MLVRKEDEKHKIKYVQTIMSQVDGCCACRVREKLEDGEGNSRGEQNMAFHQGQVCYFFIVDTDMLAQKPAVFDLKYSHTIALGIARIYICLAIHSVCLVCMSETLLSTGQRLVAINNRF